jgi:RNA polymerase-binding transcription factor DksA
METTRDLLIRLAGQARAEAATLEADLLSLFEASQVSNADDEHDPEGQTIAYERAQLTAVLEATRRHVGELEEAVSRLDAGSYGVCEVCGKAIPPERLEARPTARRCVSCA